MRRPLLLLTAALLLDGVPAGTDPPTARGHVVALTVGVAGRPVVRRRARVRAGAGTGAPFPPQHMIAQSEHRTGNIPRGQNIESS
ncbi:hypothetical protein ACE1SV_43890 [Streptomyces sp. E-15]